MSGLRVYVEGVGLWSTQLANFAALQTLLAGQAPEPPGARPAAASREIGRASCRERV